MNNKGCDWNKTVFNLNIDDSIMMMLMMVVVVGIKQNEKDQKWLTVTAGRFKPVDGIE